MVIYEVNTFIQKEIAKEYLTWLVQHIKDIIQCEGFVGAKTYDLPSEDGKVHKTIHYFVKDQKSLDLYLKEKAPAFRQDAIDRFGNKFTATRRVLTLDQELK